MMLLPCPWCGPRNVTEFAYRGENIARPDPNTADKATWRDYLYYRSNRAGWEREGWFHRAGCRQFFSIERNRTTNETRGVGTPDGAGDAAHSGDSR
ncbi:MAG: sarcosine oxidase subunit delta [Pseudonocardiales bacterium]|nr:MAG: sarcosine oxidase subunit delta [Pseudonocardiales bacterium]